METIVQVPIQEYEELQKYKDLVESQGLCLCEDPFGVLKLYPVNAKFTELKKNLYDYKEYIRNFYRQANHSIIEHNKDIQEFNRLPWYKKMFRELDTCGIIEFNC